MPEITLHGSLPHCCKSPACSSCTLSRVRVHEHSASGCTAKNSLLRGFHSGNLKFSPSSCIIVFISGLGRCQSGVLPSPVLSVGNSASGTARALPSRALPSPYPWLPELILISGKATSNPNTACR